MGTIPEGLAFTHCRATSTRLVCVSVLILRYREWDERAPAPASPRVASVDVPLLAAPEGCVDDRGLVGLPGVLQLSADRAVVWMWGRRVTTYSAAVQCLLVFVLGMSLACAMVRERGTCWGCVGCSLPQRSTPYRFPTPGRHPFRLSRRSCR